MNEKNEKLTIGQVLHDTKAVTITVHALAEKPPIFADGTVKPHWQALTKSIIAREGAADCFDNNGVLIISPSTGHDLCTSGFAWLKNLKIHGHNGNYDECIDEFNLDLMLIKSIKFDLRGSDFADKSEWLNDDNEPKTLVDVIALENLINEAVEKMQALDSQYHAVFGCI